MCLRAIVDISGGLIPPWRAQATPAYPPTLIVHGDQDTVVAVSHAYGLDRLLSSLDVEHELAILPGESHWFTPGAHTHILDLVTNFLVKHLGPDVALPLQIEPVLHS
jgi:predicted esterase